MSKTFKDGLFFALFGLCIGGFLGVILTGAYVDWRFGIPLDQFQLLDAFRVSPWGQSPFPKYWTQVLYVSGGLGLVGAVAAVVLGVRPSLDSHGSARWASVQDLQKNGLLASATAIAGPVYAKTSGPKGRGKFITSKDIPHSFIGAPTGSGKGVGVVIPTLLTYPGSVICLDVKGENFEKTSRQRLDMGDKVFKFSPFDSEGRTHRFNPLDGLAGLSPDHQQLEAERIVEALLVAPGKGAEGFIQSAKEILAATILVSIERGKPSLGEAYRILTSGGDPDDDKTDFTVLFEKLAAQTSVEAARSVFNTVAMTDVKTVSAYMSVLMSSGLSQWRFKLLRDATETSDFSISELRKRPASIYIVVNPNDLAILAPMIRLLFQQTVATLQRAEPGKDEPYPVLLLMDEFPSLGKMDALSQGITTLRSYGGRLMIVAQSISNLKATYGPDGAQNLLANCRLQLYMAPADAETPEYVSKAIGDFTRKSRSKSWQMNKFGGANISEREEGARLLRPEDLRRLSDDKVVLLIQGQDAVLADKVRYYEDRDLKTIFETQKGPLPEPEKLVVPQGVPDVEPEETGEQVEQTAPTKSAMSETGVVETKEAVGEEPSPIRRLRSSAPKADPTTQELLADLQEKADLQLEKALKIKQAILDGA